MWSRSMPATSSGCAARSMLLDKSVFTRALHDAGQRGFQPLASHAAVNDDMGHVDTERPELACHALRQHA